MQAALAARVGSAPHEVSPGGAVQKTLARQSSVNAIRVGDSSGNKLDPYNDVFVTCVKVSPRWGSKIT